MIIEKQGDPSKIVGIRSCKNASEFFQKKINQGVKDFPSHHVQMVLDYFKKKESPDFDRLDISQGFEKRFKTVKERVTSIVKNDKYARKHYWWLYLLYLAKMKQIKIITKDNTTKITSPETVSRALRELVKEAKEGKEKLQFLLKDTETLEKREQERLNYETHYNTKNNDVTLK